MLKYFRCEQRDRKLQIIRSCSGSLGQEFLKNWDHRVGLVKKKGIPVQPRKSSDPIRPRGWFAKGGTASSPNCSMISHTTNFCGFGEKKIFCKSYPDGISPGNASYHPILVRPFVVLSLRHLKVCRETSNRSFLILEPWLKNSALEICAFFWKGYGRGTTHAWRHWCCRY